MEKTDPDLVSLLIDTGHMRFANGNCVELIDKYSDRIKHVHLKDIRSEILEETNQNNYSFKEAVEAGVFTVPGDGCMDFIPMFKLLAQCNYQGWFIVEAEQDPVMANPLEYAKKARAFLKQSCDL